MIDTLAPNRLPNMNILAHIVFQGFVKKTFVYFLEKRRNSTSTLQREKKKYGSAYSYFYGLPTNEPMKYQRPSQRIDYRSSF